MKNDRKTTLGLYNRLCRARETVIDGWDNKHKGKSHKKRWKYLVLPLSGGATISVVTNTAGILLVTYHTIIIFVMKLYEKISNKDTEKNEKWKICMNAGTITLLFSSGNIILQAGNFATLRGTMYAPSYTPKVIIVLQSYTYIHLQVYPSMPATHTCTFSHLMSLYCIFPLLLKQYGNTCLTTESVCCHWYGVVRNTEVYK